jgi:TM2 domain-containing membrane protein YozV
MTDTARVGLSLETQALMAFEASKKSAGVTYLLWFFLGGIGVHRFYMGRAGSAVGMIILNVLGWVTLIVGVGLLFFLALGIWLIVDAFLIPGWVRQHNTMLMAKLSSGSSPLAVAAAS